MQYYDRHNNPTPPNDPVDQAVEMTARSYRSEVLKATWRGRSRGFWAGIAMGSVFGAVTGTVTALCTAALASVTLPAAIALIPIAAASFAAVGMTLGAAVCTSVGANASAVAGGLKEQDRRMIEDKVAEGKNISDVYNPDLDDPHPEKGFLKQFTQGSKQLFKWKVAAFGVLAGAAAGGIIAVTGGLGFFGSAAFATIGTAMTEAGIASAAVAEVTKMMTIVGASLFGGVFGLDMPTIATNTMNFTGKLLSGEMFESKEEARARAITKDINNPVVQQRAASHGKVRETSVTPQDMQVMFERTEKEHYPLHAQKEAERKALETATAALQR